MMMMKNWLMSKGKIAKYLKPVIEFNRVAFMGSANVSVFQFFDEINGKWYIRSRKFRRGVKYVGREPIRKFFFRIVVALALAIFTIATIYGGIR